MDRLGHLRPPFSPRMLPASGPRRRCSNPLLIRGTDGRESRSSCLPQVLSGLGHVSDDPTTPSPPVQVLFTTWMAWSVLVFNIIQSPQPRSPYYPSKGRDTSAGRPDNTFHTRGRENRDDLDAFCVIDMALLSMAGGDSSQQSEELRSLSTIVEVFKPRGTRSSPVSNAITAWWHT